MPVTTSTAFATQTRLADEAVSARGGANLLRQSFDGQLPDAAFKAQGDGTVLVEGMDLLKSGTFYGMFGAISLTDDDLDALVTRFSQLADSGTFLPPFRLDHSWSVLSVVGWFESIETYTRVDTTDSMEKSFLRGNVRITGSVDYTAEQVVSAMKRGALRNRSSEVGAYMTNSGVEIPLAYYGCAYVDIPAVEGLAPVEGLSRPMPHTIINLSASPEGTPPMQITADQLARLTALRAQAELTEEENDELATLSALPGAPDPEPEGNDDGEGDGEGSGDGSEGDAGDDAGDEGEGSDEGEGDGAGTGDESNDDDDEVAQLRAQVAQLRSESADREIATFSTTGAITDTNRDAAEALLRHDDPEVRRCAGTLLGSLSGRVQLGRRRGQQSLSGSGNASGGDTLIRLGMPKDEVGPLWASLSTAERKLRQPEYDAWRRDRDENGTRD